MESVSLLARSLGPAIGLGFFRLAAMTMTLGAVTLTYHVLSPANFALFNLATFLIAVGSALASPVNRAFWADQASANFAPATAATAAISVAAIVAGVATSIAIGRAPLAFFMPFVCAASVYAVGKILTGYGYGQFLIERRAALANLPIVVFALGELCAAGLIWALGADSVSLRLIFPGLLLLAVLLVSPLRPFLFQFLGAALRPRATLVFARKHIASLLGLRVAGYSILITASGMLERLLVTLFGLSEDRIAVAYLLALSYSVAFQTLAALIFDLARTHVFHDDSWQPEARKFSKSAALALGASTIAAIAVFPLLTWIGILPGLIEFTLWAGLLVRALAILMVNQFNVDHFQRGRLGPLYLPHGLILTGVLVAFWLFRLDYPQALSGLVLVSVGMLTIGAMGLAYFRRMPR